MKCPQCFSKNTRVICTRQYTNKTKRYCRCFDCQHRYISVEIYESNFKNFKETLNKSLNQKHTLHPRQIKRGESCHFAVMTEENIYTIRELAKDFTYETIANKFGIDKGTVYRIVKRKSWAHLPDKSKVEEFH